MFAIIAIPALVLLVALHFRVASLRLLILSQAREPHPDRHKATAEQGAKERKELLAAMGELHDDIKTERIARGAAAVAIRAAEHRASRPAPPLGGDPAEPADVDRETLTTAPPAGCAPAPATPLDDDPTTVISRAALAVAGQARART